MISSSLFTWWEVVFAIYVGLLDYCKEEENPMLRDQTH